MNPTDVTAIVREPVRGGHIPGELTGLAGIDLLRLLQTQHVQWPPIAYLTGMRFTEVGNGTATFTLPITDWLKTPQGIVTGGEVAILADGPLGCAVHSILPPGAGYTTTELSISMVRPVPPSGGRLVARGNLVHGGRQLALSEVFVTDDTGRLIAHGTSRCFVFRPLVTRLQDPSMPVSLITRISAGGCPRTGALPPGAFWTTRCGPRTQGSRSWTGSSRARCRRRPSPISSGRCPSTPRTAAARSRRRRPTG